MTPNPYHRRPTGLPRVHGPSCPSSAASCHCAPPPRRLSRVPPSVGPRGRGRCGSVLVPNLDRSGIRFKDTAGGDGTHSRHTGTRITRITQTNLTTIQTHQPTAVHTATNPRPSGRGPHTVAGSREATGTAPVPGSLLKPPDSEFSESFRLRTPYSTVQDIASLCCTGTRHRPAPSVRAPVQRRRGEPGAGSRDTHRIAHSLNGTHRARCSVLERRYKAKGGTAHLSLLSLTSYQTVLSLDPA